MGRKGLPPRRYGSKQTEREETKTALIVAAPEVAQEVLGRAGKAKQDAVWVERGPAVAVPRSPIVADAFIQPPLESLGFLAGQILAEEVLV